MIDSIKPYVWLLLGVALVTVGVYKFVTDQNAASDYSAYTLVGVGLVMVSAEKAKEVSDIALGTWKRFREKETPPPTAATTAPSAAELSTLTPQIKQDVISEDAPPPDPDEWIRTLRPVLYQASHYSVPTYYLNNDLQIIDWNIAFELIFRDILGQIRNRHVNFFIVKLENKSKCFDHARDFTKDVRGGKLALVDTEPLVYHSTQFGTTEACTIEFLKVATLLSNSKGEQQGWAVALFPREIKWSTFESELSTKIREDKLWSVYSPAYDSILRLFPQYLQLVKDVIAAVPAGGKTVIDLGAGTGGVVTELLKGGNRITAVENNLNMLEKLRERKFDPLAVTIIKGSVEYLHTLVPKLKGTFDAATMVNVLYAVRSPLDCLQSIYALLKPGGVLAFSTTHRETRLDQLLEAIKQSLIQTKDYNRLANDYERLSEANRDIEKTIACRWTREQYKDWVKAAGFHIIKDVPSTYENAVMLIHAMKPEDAVDSTS